MAPGVMVNMNQYDSLSGIIELHDYWTIAHMILVKSYNLYS